MRTLLPLLMLTALAIPAAAQPAASPATAPATQPAALPPLDPQWTALLSRLADPTPATRDAAQKELAALPNTDHPYLKRLAAQCTDPDLKARLTARAAEMELELAIDPPPISIDVDNATVSDIADFFNKLAGTSLQVWPPNESTARCTLKMTHAPFWDIFAAISQQMPLSFRDMGGQLTLEPDSTPLNNYIRVKGFAIIPISISRTSSVNFQQPGGAQPHPPQFGLSFSIVADPRIKIVSASPSAVTRVTDDAGNLLYQGPSSSGESGESRGVFSGGVSFPIPKNVGKKIASLKGDIRFVIALEVQTIEVPDLEKAYTKPVTIAGRTVKFSTFKVQGNNIEFNADLKQPALAKFLSGSGPAVTMTFVDANNKAIWSGEINGGYGGGVGGSEFAKPIKLRLTYPTRTREVTIPFELKDIPLPAK